MEEMSIKIEDAEVLTSVGVRRIEELFKNLSANIRKDLKNFSSGVFYCVVVHDNGKFRNDYDFNEWITDTASILYKNGEIILKTYGGWDDEITFELEVSEFWRIKKMDFSAFWEEFEKFINLYNQFSKEKDEEIKEFIKKMDYTEIY